ncbi:unnamed protein product [Cuscuta campestris]|uniref:DUF4283 domain-containing protein n=1 Tax=Cuscuta campestris TaxID=132261 RepID=A0A484M0G2_9ASTE|nr:unnamed protein product [Cuscuta campestris]
MARKRGRPRKKAMEMQSTPKSMTTIITEQSADDARSKLQKMNSIPNTPIEVFPRTLDNTEILEGEGSNKTLEPKGKKPSYAEVVEGKDKIEYELTFIQSEEINGQCVAKILEEDLIEDLGIWDQAIVLCVLGANPPLEVIDGYVHRIWKGLSIEEVCFMKEGQYLISFKQAADRDEVLKRKYYYFDKKPLLVKAWSPGCQIDVIELKDVPIYVTFPGLNMKYWSLTGLSKLRSMIGKPVRRDKAIATRIKWGSARIQVEVQVQQNFLNEEGRIIFQSVEYEWRPTICERCNRTGHTGDECRNKQDDNKGKGPIKKVWKPKQKQVEVPKQKQVNELEPYERENKEELEDVQEYVAFDQGDGFQEVSKKKSARKITIDKLNKGSGGIPPTLVTTSFCHDHELEY